MSQTAISGIRVFGNERPSKNYGVNRVCREQGCGTRLSRYNSGAFCYQHEPKREPRTRGRKVSA